MQHIGFPNLPRLDFLAASQSVRNYSQGLAANRKAKAIGRNQIGSANQKPVFQILHKQAPRPVIFLFGTETPCLNCFDLLFKSEVWGQISDCGNWGCELG